MTRYTIDITAPGRKGSLIENQKKKRKIFLEKIAEYINTIDMRERILIKLLSWLEEWSKCLIASEGRKKVNDRVKLNQMKKARLGQMEETNPGL